MMGLPLQKIAEQCHLANIRVCETNAEEYVHPKWDDLSIETKASAIDGGMHVITQYIQGLEVLPSDCHNNWIRYKTLAGWTYGEVKDDNMKTHPCLLPYHALPIEQQIKDLVFIAVTISCYNVLVSCRDD